MDRSKACHYGLAFIVEGFTEKVFYLEYLSQLCKVRGLDFRKVTESQEDCYIISSSTEEVIVMMFSTNSVSQMTNSATWFERACVNNCHHEIQWTAFLCYDTNEYNSDITKFHEGDWVILRASIEKQAIKVVDLAAEAEIEDMILCDFSNVLSYLGLPLETKIPSGNKGKAKLKKLYRMVAVNNAYHAGVRAKNLIASLDMNIIKESAPIPLKEIDEAVKIA